MGCSQSKPVASSTAIRPAAAAAATKANVAASRKATATAAVAAAAGRQPTTTSSANHSSHGDATPLPQSPLNMSDSNSTHNSTQNTNKLSVTNGCESSSVTSNVTDSSVAPVTPVSLSPLWTLVIWKQLQDNLLDPSDVHAVLSERRRHHINRLGSTEVVLIQRRVRQVTAKLPKTPPTNKTMIARFTNTATFNTGESRVWVEKYHQLDETVVRSIFVAGDGLWRETCVDWRPHHKTTTSLDIFANVYTLLAHLSSENLWDRTSAIAIDSSKKAGLERDVNKYNGGHSEAPPVPSLTLYTKDESEGVFGASMSSICFCLGLGLRGTRNQRLQLLFYLFLPPKTLSTFLMTHPSGGLPTWLLEVDSDVIFSLASMSHYYYFGTSLTSITTNDEEPKTKPHKALTIHSLHVMEAIANLMNNNTSKISRSSTHDGTTNNGTERSPEKSGRGRGARRDSGSIEVLQNQHEELRDTELMRSLRSVRHGNSRTKYSAKDFGGYKTACEPHLSKAAAWTMEDFEMWATAALSDFDLDIVMHKLLASGILPSPEIERDLVAQEWQAWQQTDFKLWSLEDGEVLPFDSFSNCVQGFHGFAKRDQHVHAQARTWGGIGGFDGRGGLGHGVMYVIEKSWWDSWAEYVGWSWDDGTPTVLSRLRPSDLSTERLLDRFSDVSVAGTLGSYEIMKKDLQKGFDYMLVPTGVWDILYELYAGGPPLPRMVVPPRRIESARDRSLSGEGKIMEDADCIEVIMCSESNPNHLVKIPEIFMVATHPWILHFHLCDATQPYRRGDTGPMSIRVMATPDQPLWRLYAEVVVRLQIHSSRSMDPEGRGQARLWKRIDPSSGTEPVSRYGPWSLLCKSRSALFPILNLNYDNDDLFQELKEDWQAYADGATVEGVGLTNNDRIMVEYAVLNKNSDFIWPREAAAKAGRVRRLADEDLKFRSMLRCVDENGVLLEPPPNLVGITIDAMDSTGRWFQAEIVQAERAKAEVVTQDQEEQMERIDGFGNVPVAQTPRRVETGEIKHILVDFSENGSGGSEWIDVDSDRLAVAGRFTIDKEDEGSLHSHVKSPTEKAKNAVAGKKTVNDTSDPMAVKICTLPGYGACGLNNLGNTCYANAAIQCISYLPMLRSYLISSQYKATGDLNKDNPLGTGGKLLEEFAELMRIMWSGKYGERSPTRFRGLLGKHRSQFAAADQQDAQELLNYMLDVLHEDSNRVKQKPYVEALEDDWVKENSLSRVGEEAWRRFLRRNRSIMADIAMGQVLNTVTCPKCHFASRNFDPFNLLSIPFPTVADVVFQCTVVRRASFANSPKVLNKSKKGNSNKDRFELKEIPDDLMPPSERFVSEQYVIEMSRLADIGDLRLRLQNISGIATTRMRLCRAEEVIVNSETGDHLPIKRHTRFTPLPDKEGPCVQVAKGSQSDDASVTPATPTHIIVFESTLRPRPMLPEPIGDDTGEGDNDDVSTADEDEAGDKHKYQSCTVLQKEMKLVKQLLSVYGDSQECRIYDTDPLLISKAISRSLWPKTENEFKLGLRVDAIDHRDHWFPGSVVEIMEGVINDSVDHSQPYDNAAKTKVKIHFDNFSSKWDETYTIDHFNLGQVTPLYSHATPRPKPTEFLVHHRFYDKEKKTNFLFGQGFSLQCESEWSTARSGAHILGQASRYLQETGTGLTTGQIDVNRSQENDTKLLRMYEKAQSSVSDMIDLLLERDRVYVREALGLINESDEIDLEIDHSNPSFDATVMSAALVKKVGSMLLRLPFEVRVSTADTLLGNNGPSNEEVPFPFSLMRTIGNYMSARHVIVLHWRELPTEKKTSHSNGHSHSPIMYTSPHLAIHKSSSQILEAGCKTSRHLPGSGGMHLGVCLDEFCKINQLDLNDCWRCPRCKENREGKQNMNLWRLPDLLTFHIKRFNCSARWREKISTKVNFPLTGLDVSEWCHPESPAIREGKDSYVYDLISVVNHYGGMTGGHYVATCKATACGPDGSEELAYNFNGTASGPVEDVMGDSSISNGWRLPGRKDKESVSNLHKQMATLAAKGVAESAEPLWLQFDDELVEPIPPRNVVSEMAYVLFYRRRKLTPANVAKYCSLE